MAIGTSYQFLPWVRRGLSVALDTADTLGALPARAVASVGVRLAGPHAGEAIAPVTMQLYGPGDVVAIDTARVVRTDPRPGITNFEPNYLAIVEFDPPDFPWMLTPASAIADDRLRPWLVLVVLDAAKVARPRLQSPALLPQIRIAAPQVADELPPLAESWSWAHAQVVSAHAAGDVAGIQSDLQADPRSNISRLVCPRRLKPDTDYIACVVPAFEPGRLRGLGLGGDGSSPAMQSLAPAWDVNAHADVVLPVYYHWEFSTGPQGDFEYLARKLRSPKKWKNDAQMAALLAKVGTAPMSVDELLNAGAPGQLTTMEGALVPLSYQPGAAPAAVHAASLAAIVNTPAQQVDNPVRDEADGRVRRIEVKPPLYGAWHARQHSVTEAQRPDWWLAGLNLNPRYRGAAGYGAEVVRKFQEDYVDACWDQVGEIRKAEALFNLTRLAIEVQRALKAKHLDVLPAERLLQLMGPALPRIEALGAMGEVLYKVNGKTASLGGQLDRSSLPAAMVDTALRRAASPQRRTLRVAAMRQHALAALPALGKTYVAAMAAASVRGDAFAVNRHLADGILGTRFFDGVALPGADDARVDLRARGLRGALAAGQVRAALAAAEQAKSVVAARGVPAPKVRPAQHLGVFTDLHIERFGTLAAGAPALGAADLGVVSAQVEALGRRGVEGFLLEAQPSSGALQFSALRIDARSGALRIERPLLRLTPQRGAQAPSAAARRALPGVVLGSIGAATAKRYGNLGLVANLPPNAIDLQGGNAGVKFELGAGLEITRADAPPPGRDVASITLPPALRQRAVLKAFADATRGVQQAWRDPFEAMRVAVQVVDFPLAQAAQVLRARTAPELTLKARLHSQLALGGTALDKPGPFAAAHLPLDAAAAAKLRLAIAPLFDRVMAYPHLNDPMYAALAHYDKEAFMPGIGQLPPDLIMLVQVNQYFVDSFMAGANFEMNRELLWRAFPTDLRGTPFQRFWDRRGIGSDGRLRPLPDMQPMHCWGAQPLGQRSDPNITDPDRVALLIKGQLLLRYPNALVYAWKRRKSLPPEQSKLLKNAAGLPPNPATDIQTPVFAGFIAPDISFFGFDIDRGDIADWCFVVEEQMSEPRFGFDVPVAPPGAGGAQAGARIGARPRAALSYAREQFARGDQADPQFKAFAAAGFSPWKALSWSQLPVAAGAHLSIAALAGLSQPGNEPFASFPGLSATPTAAEIAQKLLQEPFRAYWEGPDLAT